MPHIIKINSGSRMPKCVVSVDVETYQRKSTYHESIKVHSMRLWTAWIGVYKDGKQTDSLPQAGASSKSFWKVIERMAKIHKEIYIAAHNANFDMSILDLPHLLDKGEFDLSFCCLESPPYIVSGKMYGVKVHIIDTLNYYQMALSQLGQWLLIPKLPMPAESAPDSEWEKYCYRDSEIVHRTMRDLIGTVKEEDWGSFRPTAASQGWNAYRHRWMDRDIRVHCHAPTLSLEREAYYGGTERLFQYGNVKGPLYHIDMTWAYGITMASDRQPYKAIDYIIHPSRDFLESVIGQFVCAARVRIKSADVSYPVRRDGRVINAYGSFTTTLCGGELYRAWTRGHVTFVGSIAVYECTDLFGNFVGSMLSAKHNYSEQGKLHIAHLAKRMVNGLYGKFAQTVPEWEEDKKRFPLFAGEQWHSYNEATGKLYTHRQLAGKVETLSGRAEGDDSVPIISANIASGLRCRMEDAILAIGEDNCVLQYCDALIITKKGYHNAQKAGIMSETAPGHFKVTGKYKEGTFFSATDYVVDGQHRICGVPSKAYQQDGNTYVYDHWESPHEVFARNPDGTVLVIRQTKTMQRQPPIQGLDERNRVNPIVLDD